MGTRGPRGYRYRGKYFIHYNQYDSYPDGLENLSFLKSLQILMLSKWLEGVKEYYEEENNRVSAPSVNENEEEQNDFGYYYKPSAEPPMNYIMIEWTYVIDLDRMVFTVDGMAHFRLDSIPRDEVLIELLCLDGRGDRCLDVACAPALVGDTFHGIHPPAPPPAGTVAYESIQEKITLVDDESTWSPTETTSSCAVAAELGKTFVAGHYSIYSRLGELYFPSNNKAVGGGEGLLDYKRVALALLYVATPGAMHTLPQVAEEDCEPNGDVKGLQYPSSHIFNFRGCLVSITAFLDVRENFEAEVGLMASKLLTEGTKADIGLIWSIKHIVIVKRDKGLITFSSAIPAIDPCSSSWPQCLTSSLRLLSHYLSTTAELFHDVKPEFPRRSPMTESSIRAPLPLDIIASIVPYADSETHRVLMALSKDCRQLLLTKPRIGKYTILQALPSSTPIRRCGDVGHFRAKDQDGATHIIRFVGWKGSSPKAFPPFERPIPIVASRIRADQKSEQFPLAFGTENQSFVGTVN